MQKKDYELVVELALAGERQDGKFRGLRKQWKEYRYTAYQRLGNRAAQRDLAMDFILYGSFEHYLELKSTYEPEEWRSVYPGIISQLEKDKKADSSLYISILIEEGEWQRLLAYVKKHPRLIEYFYKYLVSKYKEEVYDLFIQYIEHTAAWANNRGGYQRVCELIKLLKKAGGRKEAQEFKQQLLEKYPRKRALKDELSRV